MTPQECVTEFHETFGLPAGEDLYDSPVELARLRVRLLNEEAREAEEAVLNQTRECVAQELADVVYVAYGTAITYGIDLDACIREVHRSNMSKLDKNGNPVHRDDGKVLKSSLYEPPNIRKVLREQ